MVWGSVSKAEIFHLGLVFVGELFQFWNFRVVIEVAE
jgi:hypothetical protein